MRRVPTLLTIGLALFLATACGGDGGGGNGDTGNGGGSPDATDATSATGGTAGTAGTASVEEVCADLEEAVDTLDTAQDLRGALTDAVASGDQAAIDEASADYREFGTGLAQDLRDIAETSADPELRSAVETFADELETLTIRVAESPDQADSLDTAAFQAAGDDVEEICGF
jgi:hypothetical protein